MDTLQRAFYVTFSSESYCKALLVYVEKETDIFFSMYQLRNMDQFLQRFQSITLRKSDYFRKKHQQQQKTKNSAVET